MNIALRALALAAIMAPVLAIPLAAEAHRQWMVPSATVLSGEDPWVTVDAAISNELFHPDHRPMRLDGVVVTAPDGAVVKIENPSTGQFRSTFDVHLTQSGTYRITNGSQLLSARYKLDGVDKTWRGSSEAMAREIPTAATDVKVTENQNRIETFVTRGKPTQTALKPTGEGLELVPVTHPNDVVAGEAANFTLMLDGKPAAGVEVTTIPGASRYRSAPGEIKVRTGADGRFTLTWPEAGMWWVNAAIRDDKGKLPGVTRSAAYSATFEVLRP